MKVLEPKYFKDYDIEPWPEGHINLDVGYSSDYGDPFFIRLDAVEVYTNLKRYFKDTEYE